MVRQFAGTTRFCMYIFGPPGLQEAKAALKRGRSLVHDLTAHVNNAWRKIDHARMSAQQLQDEAGAVSRSSSTMEAADGVKGIEEGKRRLASGVNKDRQVSYQPLQTRQGTSRLPYRGCC